MKTKSYLLLIATIGLIVVGCDKKEEIGEPIGKPTSMTISLKNNTQTKAIGAPTQNDENTVNDFTVYVYNGNSSILEKTAPFTPSSSADFTQTITGLVTGPKKVVVLANTPSGYTVVAGSSYNDLAAKRLDLDTQTDFTNLAMSGETTVTLTTSTNQVTIPLSRIVAKIILGNVTVTPDPGHDGTFTVDSIYIMKAKNTSSMGIPTIITDTDFYGGIAGIVSQTVKTYLAETTIADMSGTNARFFYVFPNDNTNNNATLITLKGTYNGGAVYFPFRIDADGDYILRNTSHLINVTIKRPGNGSTDPETPVDPATLQVTITPQNWIVVPTQSVTW